MQRTLFFLIIAMGTMVNSIAGTCDSEAQDIGTIDLVSVEPAHALNNPDVMPYDRFNSDEKLLKITFQSNVDLLDFARVQNREVGYGFQAHLCEISEHHRPIQSQYSTILDSSELFQSGIGVARQTVALLLPKSADPRERQDANLHLLHNKKRTQMIYYFYIRPHSALPVNTVALSIPIESRTDNDYNLEKTPADICFRLESNRMVSGVPVKPTIYSNTIRIPKEAIAAALKRD